MSHKRVNEDLLATHEGFGRRDARWRAEDYDAHTPWRHLLCYMQRAGVAKGIKSAYNKRSRARAKRALSHL